MSIVATPIVQQLWNDAREHPDTQWSAACLWQYLSNNVIFPEASWVVAATQPVLPPRDRRRIEIVAEERDPSHAHTLTTVLCMVSKRADIPFYEQQTLEYHAYVAACARYIAHHPTAQPVTGAAGAEGAAAAAAAPSGADLPRIWVITVMGTRAKLWAFHHSVPFFIPVLPDYVEISENGQALLQALNQVKAHRFPVRIEAVPRPVGITLVEGWRDDEVVELDNRRLRGQY